MLILSCQGRLGTRTIQPRKIENSKLKTKKEGKKKKLKRKHWEQINIMNYNITFLKLVQVSGLQNHRKLTEVLLQARLT